MDWYLMGGGGLNAAELYSVSDEVYQNRALSDGTLTS